jgi:hypothetical protein
VDDGSAFVGQPTGFGAVTRPNGQPIGIYCLTPAPGSGINTTNPNAVVSPDWGDSNGNDLAAYAETAGVEMCPNGTVEVHTYDFTGTLSNSVAFTIIVP